MKILLPLAFLGAGDLLFASIHLSKSNSPRFERIGISEQSLKLLFEKNIALVHTAFPRGGKIRAIFTRITKKSSLYESVQLHSHFSTVALIAASLPLWSQASAWSTALFSQTKIVDQKLNHRALKINKKQKINRTIKKIFFDDVRKFVKIKNRLLFIEKNNQVFEAVDHKFTFFKTFVPKIQDSYQFRIVADENFLDPKSRAIHDQGRTRASSFYQGNHFARNGMSHVSFTWGRLGLMVELLSVTPLSADLFYAKGHPTFKIKQKLIRSNSPEAFAGSNFAQRLQLLSCESRSVNLCSFFGSCAVSHKKI